MNCTIYSPHVTVGQVEIDREGCEYVSAAVRLPAEAWDILTDDLRSLLRRDGEEPQVPDLDLLSRIALFLEMRMIAWKGDMNLGDASAPDLCDGYPF